MRAFDEWVNPLTQYSSIDQFNGTVIAIDAAHYLNHLLYDATFTRFREPLLPALGGQPFVLKAHLQSEVHGLRQYGITPYFVFPGLDYGKKGNVGRGYEESLRLIGEAWNLYRSSQPGAAVETFGRSGKHRSAYPEYRNTRLICLLGAIKPEALFRFMQSALQELEVEFVVAPYSASAQVRRKKSPIVYPKPLTDP